MDILRLSVQQSLRCTIVITLIGMALAYHPSLFSQAVYTDDKGVALQGYDPVAYFTKGEPARGTIDFQYEWQGAIWLFVNAENREKFKTSPEKYAPQYGGFCAFGVCVKNGKFPADPTAWKIVGGKLYLNYNKNVQALWEKSNLPTVIDSGDEHWKTLQRIPASSTKR